MFSNQKHGFIGIDIGSSTVKVAQVQQNGDRLSLVDAAIVPRRQAWDFETGNGLTPQSSSGEVQAAVSIASRLLGTDSASTATMAICDVRRMKIELARDHSLNLAQIESQFTAIDRLDPRTRQIDYCPIHSDWQTYTSNVHVLSMPTDWASQIGDDQSLAGLNCQLLDCQPASLARAAQLSNTVRPGEPVAVIDWGHQRATLCLVVDGAPVFIRLLRGCGFSHTVEAVCQILDVKDFEATRLLQQSGVTLATQQPTQLQTVIEEAASYSLAVFLNELARTWDYLTKNHADQLPRKILLMGGGSTINNISQWLENKTTLFFEPWQLPDCETKIGSHASYPLSLFGPAVAMSALAFKPMECQI